LKILKKKKKKKEIKVNKIFRHWRCKRRPKNRKKL